MPEPILVALGLAIAAAVVLLPLRRGGSDEPPLPDEGALVRHRAALEALNEVEADYRAGTLDDEAYARELAAAERRASETRAALHARAGDDVPRPDGRARRLATGAAAVIGLALLAGSALPATGVANRTVVDQALAERQATEEARQARIRELTDALVADPSDTATLSDLADAYLAGTSDTDLVAAVRILQLLLEYEPENASAYERVVSAYIRGGDHANARAALDSYETIESADPVEVAFLDGLIALQGEADREAAIEAFDRFLELAPDDARVPMIRGLREDAAAGE
ncbi:MAG TPA: hypothetical protein VHR55_11100 [Candidatus Limnocylindria bacterium]|nr:hypothetical protein [Candidatus Limnocylindria bacterium]